MAYNRAGRRSVAERRRRPWEPPAIGLPAVTLILGGARSGKSAHAEALVAGSGLAAGLSRHRPGARRRDGASGSAQHRAAARRRAGGRSRSRWSCREALAAHAGAGPRRAGRLPDPVAHQPAAGAARRPAACRRRPAGGAGGAAGAGGAGLQRGRPGHRAAGRAQPRLRRPCRPAAPAARRDGRLGPLRRRPACRSTSRRRPEPADAPPEHAAAADGSDVEPAVDLGQSPGEIVFLSAADSELACLAAAQARLPADAPEPAARQPAAARPPALGRPLCRAGGGAGPAGRRAPAGRPRLLALRPRAGRGRLPRERGIALACLPGDDRADPELAELSTLPPEALDRLWRYLRHGGIDNAEQALRYAARLLGHDVAWRRAAAPAARRALPSRPAGAEPGPAAGGAGWCSIGRWCRAAIWRRSTRCCDALAEAGLGGDRPLRDQPQGRRRGGTLVDEPSPRMRPGGDAQRHRLRRRCVDGGRRRSAGRRRRARAAGRSWPAAARRPGAHGTRGLGPRDLAMHVALPEVDGRIGAARGLVQGTRASATRAPRPSSPATGRCPTGSRMLAAAGRGLGAAARARRPPSAASPSCSPTTRCRDGRLANGVGLDVPASCVEVLQRLGAAPATASRDVPADGAELIARLAAGPDQRARRPCRRAECGSRCRSPTTASCSPACRRRCAHA